MGIPCPGQGPANKIEAKDEWLNMIAGEYTTFPRVPTFLSRRYLQQSL